MLSLLALRRCAAAATVLATIAALGPAWPGAAGVVAPPSPRVGPSALSGDFNGDGRPDIVLTGAAGWNGMATALGTGTGAFTTAYAPSPAFAAWASLPGAQIATGRFDNDADDDIVLTGVAGWTTLKMAHSNGNGTFTVSQPPAGQFPGWAATPGARVLSGDFNGDGRTDLALTATDSATTIPVAYANGNGTFTYANPSVPNFATNAQHWAARVYAADLNGDGRTDLASIPGEDALLTDLSISVAYSTGTGFTDADLSLPDFVGRSDGRIVTAGDFNGDHRTDFALVLDDQMIMAYSMGTSFALYQASATPQFYLRANQPGARIIATDNDCDGRPDLVVISEPTGTWNSIPVAMYRRAEDYFVMDDIVPAFTQFSRTPNAQLLTGDYDGDGCEDMALVGGAGWTSVPIAISNGDGSYHEGDTPASAFAGWAAGASPVVLPPPPAETLGTLSMLDTEIWSGITPSVAIGTDGLPIVSYYVSGNGRMDLRVAHCADTACTAITTNDIDTVGDVGRWSSIKIGSDGLPLISYLTERDATFNWTQDLKVAHCNDIACTSATVTTFDSVAKIDDVTSLAIGGDGFGLIAYQETVSSTSTRMKVAHCLNIACTSANLTVIATVRADNGETGGYQQTELAVGPHGLGLVVYNDAGANQILKTAACTDADCRTFVTSVVDQAPANSGVFMGGYASVAFGLDGLALISYNGDYTTSGGNLKVAHCSDVYCTASTKIVADTGGHVGWRSSTAIGADGRGVISYQDATNQDLKIAHCSNLVCSSATAITVDAFDAVGLQSSITVGTDGLPLVAYQGPGPLGVILRVIHCGNADCSAVITAPF